MSDQSPKRYLAWDTSSVTGAVAAFEINGNHSRLVAEWSLSLETSKHSERLLWTIDTVLQSAGWEISDLSGIVVGIGPGSFTGLRIGLTTAGMLAAQLKIPVTPISSLIALARPVVDILLNAKETKKTLLIACTDATKGEWFTLMGPAKAIRDCVTMAEGDLPGVWSRGVHENALTPETVFAEAKKILEKAGDEASWIAIGQSVDRYAEQFKALPAKSRIEIQTPFLNQIQPRTLALLGYEAIQQGILRDPATLKPRYLRDSEAEVKLRNGQLKPQPKFHRGGVA
jgi:tRNA threonylcarbamoyl adenosine modification protein YeaZ